MCSGKLQADASWTGGHSAKGAAPVCATQTLYHIPSSWLKADAANELTLFEGGGIAAAVQGAGLQSVGLTLSSVEAHMAPAADPQVALNTVISCEF